MAIVVSDPRTGEADEATRGSIIKLGAETTSRLVMLVTTLLLMRGLGAGPFGAFGELSVYALLLAELGELGLQNHASRVLVDGSASLASLARARLLTTALAVAVAASVSAWGALARTLDGLTLMGLVAWLLLSGWGEFLGVALRCRGRRAQEAVLLLVLRGGALGLVPAVLAAGGGLRGVGAALAVSPVPALLLAGALLRRSEGSPAPSPARLTVLRDSSPLAAHGGLLLLSPRVELLVFAWLHRGAASVGLLNAALTVYWPLAMVPLAIAAGAMPGLTREAVREATDAQRGAPVRRRTTVTLALLGVPVAVGLALVARDLMPLLLGGRYTPQQQTLAADAVAALAVAVPPLFLNAVLAATLIAAARARFLPWLTASRVALAFVLAFALIPRLGLLGAAAGLVIAEWCLLAASTVACGRAGIGVEVVRPLLGAALACVPMALVVLLLRGNLVAAVFGGVIVWLATLGVAVWLVPGRVRQLVGDFRYP